MGGASGLVGPASVRVIALGAMLLIFSACESEAPTDSSLVLLDVASVEVTPASFELQVGESRTLSATPRDADGQPLTDRSVAWSSSSPTVATVDAQGSVQALAPGTAVITATSDGVQGSASLSVPEPAGSDTEAPTLEGFSLNPISVDVSTDSATVRASLDISDDITGTRVISVHIASPTGGQAFGMSVHAPSSGTRLDGTWHADLIIPANAEAGIWEISHISLSDEVGNTRFLRTADLEAAGYPVQVEVRVQ